MCRWKSEHVPVIDELLNRLDFSPSGRFSFEFIDWMRSRNCLLAFANPCNFDVGWNGQPHGRRRTKGRDCSWRECSKQTENIFDRFSTTQGRSILLFLFLFLPDCSAFDSLTSPTLLARVQEKKKACCCCCCYSLCPVVPAQPFPLYNNNNRDNNPHQLLPSVV